MRIIPAIAALALVATATSMAAPARAADPTLPDCLAATESSLKLRSEHKLRLARAQLLVCSSPSCPAEVRQECMKRIDDVNTASPTIVLAAKNGAGRELAAVKVTIDGQVVADHLDGSALPVDPGAHEFRFEASGVPPLTQTIILHEGEKDRRETVVLGGSGAPSSKGDASEPDGTGNGDDEATAPAGTGKTQRAAGFVVGILGVAGVAAGAVSGIVASSAWRSAKQECPGFSGCSSQAMGDQKRAATGATVSTVGFIAGGVLLAAGVTLYLTAPRSGAPRVGLEVRPGGLALAGGF